MARCTIYVIRYHTVVPNFLSRAITVELLITACYYSEYHILVFLTSIALLAADAVDGTALLPAAPAQTVPIETNSTITEVIEVATAPSSKRHFVPVSYEEMKKQQSHTRHTRGPLRLRWSPSRDAKTSL